MTPEIEDRAWRALHARGAAQLGPGFADRVLRAARSAAENAPSLVGPLVLSVATAMLCFLAVAVFHTERVRAQSSRSLADWQSIALAADDSGQ